MSPIILLGLVVMWAVVLVPMWLRRHDEAEETRSVDRFTSAMHTLSRRDTAPGKKYVVMPQRSQGVDVHVSGASATGRGGRLAALRARGASRRAARRARPKTAAARRRRTLLVLLAAAAVMLIPAVLVGGMALWALQIVLDLALVGFVLLLVSQGRQARRPQSVAVARASRPARRVPQVPQVADRRDVTVVAAAAVASRGEWLFDQAAEVAEAGPIADPDEDRPEPVDLPAAAVSAEQSADLSDPYLEPEIEIGGQPWEPVPVPRPTYTTKPTAPRRRVRAPMSEPLLPPVEPTEELDPVDDLEEILDRRWAVND